MYFAAGGNIILFRKCPDCGHEITEPFSYCPICGFDMKLNDDDPTLDTLPYHEDDISSLPIQELIPGTLFAGRYLVIEKLGEGGMGSVYKVLDKEIDTKIALKLIIPEISADSRTISHFRNELITARSIIHKNVCRMYDLNKSNDYYFLTMEYVSGQDLKKMLKMTRQLSIETAVDIAIQICEGLDEAHQLGVVHRDLKTGNIMIDKHGRVRIMDFGIAHSLSEGMTSSSDRLIGTPEFMSPEQVDGRGVDQRSDIYSLGVILFQMLTGKLPFTGSSLYQVTQKQKYKNPEDPKKLNPDMPDNLRRVVLKCLEKNKEKRFSSIQQLQNELSNIKNNKSSSLENGQKAESRFMRKRLLLTAAPAMMLLLAFALLGGINLFRKPSPGPPASSSAIQPKMLAVLPFENLSEQADEYFADGLTEELTSRLSALHGLGIISSTSTRHYKNTSKTASRIGRELNVDYILEGTIRWSRNPGRSDQIRVTSQLVKTDNETQIWAETYNEVMEDIFTVQSRIAEEVAKNLDVEVLEPERKAISVKPTNNIEAFDYYLKARETFLKAYINQNSGLYAKTIELLEQAVALDKYFTLAYLWIYNTHLQMHFSGVDRSDDRLNKAQSALLHAEQLEPDLPEVRICRAQFYLRALHDYEKALEIYQEVQRARPSIPPTYLAAIHRYRGNWREAVVYQEKTFKLSPLSSDAAHVMGRIYAWIGQYRLAEEWFNRALSIYPDLYYSKLGKARLPLLAEGDIQRSLLLTRALPKHILTDYHLFELGLLEKNYPKVLQMLDSSPYESFQEAHFYIPKSLAYAWTFHMMGDLEKRDKMAKTACSELGKSLQEHPEDTRVQAALGLSYAFLGEKEAAVQHGIQSANLNPLSSNAFEGTRYVLNLARIYALTGDKLKALEQLEYLLSHPCFNNYSVSILKIDPMWDLLRSHPRFIRLANDPGAVFHSDVSDLSSL